MKTMSARIPPRASGSLTSTLISPPWKPRSPPRLPPPNPRQRRSPLRRRRTPDLLRRKSGRAQPSPSAGTSRTTISTTAKSRLNGPSCTWTRSATGRCCCQNTRWTCSGITSNGKRSAGKTAPCAHGSTASFTPAAFRATKRAPSLTRTTALSMSTDSLIRPTGSFSSAPTKSGSSFPPMRRVRRSRLHTRLPEKSRWMRKTATGGCAIRRPGRTTRTG